MILRKLELSEANSTDLYHYLPTCQTGPWWWTSRGSSAPCRTRSCPRTHRTWTSPGRERGRPWGRPAGTRSERGSPGPSWSVGWSRDWDLLSRMIHNHFFSGHCCGFCDWQGRLWMCCCCWCCWCCACLHAQQQQQRSSGEMRGPLAPVITVTTSRTRSHWCVEQGTFSLKRVLFNIYQASNNEARWYQHRFEVMVCEHERMIWYLNTTRIGRWCILFDSDSFKISCQNSYGRGWTSRNMIFYIEATQ